MLVLLLATALLCGCGEKEESATGTSSASEEISEVQSAPESTPEESEPESTPEESEPESTPEESEPESTLEESEPESTPEESEPESTPEESEAESEPEESEPEVSRPAVSEAEYQYTARIIYTKLRDLDVKYVKGLAGKAYVDGSDSVECNVFWIYDGALTRFFVDDGTYIGSVSGEVDVFCADCGEFYRSGASGEEVLKIKYSSTDGYSFFYEAPVGHGVNNGYVFYDSTRKKLFTLTMGEGCSLAALVGGGIPALEITSDVDIYAYASGIEDWYVKVEGTTYTLVMGDGEEYDFTAKKYGVIASDGSTTLDFEYDRIVKTQNVYLAEKHGESKLYGTQGEQIAKQLNIVMCGDPLVSDGGAIRCWMYDGTKCYVIQITSKEA